MFKNFQALNSAIGEVDSSKTYFLDCVSDLIDAIRSGGSLGQSTQDAYARAYAQVQQTKYDSEGNISDVTSGDRLTVPAAVLARDSSKAKSWNGLLSKAEAALADIMITIPSKQGMKVIISTLGWTFEWWYSFSTNNIQISFTPPSNGPSAAGIIVQPNRKIGTLIPSSDIPQSAVIKSVAINRIVNSLLGSVTFYAIYHIVSGSPQLDWVYVAYRTANSDLSGILRWSDEPLTTYSIGNPLKYGVNDNGVIRFEDWISFSVSTPMIPTLMSRVVGEGTLKLPNLLSYPVILPQELGMSLIYSSQNGYSITHDDQLVTTGRPPSPMKVNPTIVGEAGETNIADVIIANAPDYTPVAQALIALNN